MAPKLKKRKPISPPKQKEKLPARIIFLKLTKRKVEHTAISKSPDLFENARREMSLETIKTMDMPVRQREIEQRRAAVRKSMSSERLVRIRQELKLLQEELNATKSSVRRFNLKAKMNELRREL